VSADSPSSSSARGEAGRIVHLCYAGTSGSSRVALDIAAGSACPARHAYVLYGVDGLRADYARDLDALGCRWVFVPKRRGLDVRCWRAAAREILRLSPAVAVLHGSRSLPAALCLRAAAWRLPIVAVQHGPLREFERRASRVVCAAFSALATHTVAVSRELADAIRRRGLLRRACRPLTVIPNGADGKFWSLPPRGRESGAPLRVGMVATLEPHKDHPTLLAAMRILADGGRNVRLALVGGGSREAELRALTARLGLDAIVEFAGDLSREALRRRMEGFDVLAHVTGSEGLSMALIEGLLSGRPVVASDVPGMREMVRDGQTGLLAAPADAQAVAAALRRLNDEPLLAARLGAQAAQFAREHFSATRMAEQYEALAERVASA